MTQPPDFYATYFGQRSPPDAPPALILPPHLSVNGNAEAYARAALQRETHAVATAPNGTRNHTLNRATFNLAQLAAGGALTQADVVAHLTAAAQTAGLDDRETAATIASGWNAGTKSPRGVPPPAGGIGGAGGPVTVLGEPLARIVSDDIGDKVRERLPLLDWHELYSRVSTEEWILEPIWPARRLIAIYSAPKVGKSLLMLEIAVAVARGSRVLGVTPDRARRVLYVDFENDPESDIRERLIAMHIKPDDLDNLCYLSFPNLAHLDTEAGSLELLAAVDTYHCDAVVIDTVSRSVGGDENANDTWLAFYRHTGLKLKQAGIALVRLDHAGKDETKGQRGGSAKVGDVDAVWRLSKVTDTTLRLDCEAHRFPVAEQTLVLHRKDDPLRHLVDAEGSYGAYRTKMDAALAALATAGVPADAPNSVVQDALKMAGIGLRATVIAEVVRRRKLSALPVSRLRETRS